MLNEHIPIERPDDENIKIWRYMDFTKFIDMLKTKKLFFVRVDKLDDDPFEGSIPWANYLHRIVHNKNYPEKLEYFRNRSIAMRRSTAVNCWHMNEHESLAMWRLYTTSNEGIAIQSTFKSLVDSFNGPRDDGLIVGKVKYIDYRYEQIPETSFVYPFLYKRKSFEHERELRALIVRLPKEKDKNGGEVVKLDSSQETIQGDGIKVNVKLEQLIHAVYVSPTSKVWFKELVESILNEFGVNKPVSLSPLSDDSPLY